MKLDAVFAKFLTQAREKAAEVVGLAHTGAEAKDVIKDLLTIVGQMERALTDQEGVNADTRLQQRRDQALKVDHRELQKSLDELRETLTMQLTIQAKKLTTEANLIKNKGQELSNPELQQSALRLSDVAKRIIEMITKL